jgi:hypothetical protein
MDPVTSSNSAPVSRRAANGRLQACDPCRRQKLACDHSIPCLRCRRTKRESRCIYSGPLRGPAKIRPGSSKRHSTSLATTTTTAQVPLTDADAASTCLECLTCQSDESLSQLRGSIGSDQSDGLPYSVTSAGYLGFTSFKSVYEETQNSLSQLGAQPLPGEAGFDDESGDIFENRAPIIRKLCIEALRRVPSPQDGFRLFRHRKDSQAFETGVHHAAQMMLQQLYDYWGDYLSPDRTEEQLELMAQAVSFNTRKDLAEDMTEPEAWIEQFTGPNLRWEALGVLFNFWKLKEHPRDSALFPRDQEAIGLCIRICREFVGSPTTWLMYLYYRRTILETMNSGDASKHDISIFPESAMSLTSSLALPSWRYQAQAVAIFTFRGVHAEPESEYTPTIACEFKRRFMWAMFSTDKCLTCFTGRPPLLSRHYISTPMPLDLKDEYLFLDGESLRRKVAESLDDKGWNTEGGVWHSTLLRARAMQSLIADEIFEVVLGANVARYSTDALL